mmetsp:Transcript_72044/g.168746  ORF Transcript_72044/g.168746 Transcript_72044/m.168746 type:complete len:297 (+) Transcript_72044:55-945(+)
MPRPPKLESNSLSPGDPVSVYSRNFGWCPGQVADSDQGGSRVRVEFQADGLCCRKDVPCSCRFLRSEEEIEDEQDPDMLFDSCLNLLQGVSQAPAPPKVFQVVCPRCGNENAKQPEGATHVKCPKCGKRCIKCKGLWINENHDCSFVAAWDKMKNGHFGEYLKARVRVGKELGDKEEKQFTVCPKCLQGIMKEDDDQCDHMTCFNCSHEFCFECHADRTAIKAHGNHYHQPTCRYHFIYFGKDEYLPDQCRQCRDYGHLCIRPGGQKLWDAYGRQVAAGEITERKIYEDYGHNVQW